MKKVILIALLIIPCFLYSQEQVPETFSDGKSFRPTISLVLDGGFGKTTHNYNSSSIGSYKVNSIAESGNLTFLVNNGFLSYGLIYSWLSYDYLNHEAENYFIEEKNLINIKKQYRFGVEADLNLIRRTIIQPKIGLGIGYSRLKFEHTDNSYINSVSEPVYSKEYYNNLYISAIVKLQVYFLHGWFFYFKGETDINKYIIRNKLPYELNHSPIISFGIGISG